MKANIFFLLLSFLFFVNSAYGQETEIGIKPCGTSSVFSSEEDSLHVVPNFSTSQIRSSSVRTIPVVFHILHRSGQENILKDDIYSALEQRFSVWKSESMI